MVRERNQNRNRGDVVNLSAIRELVVEEIRWFLARVGHLWVENPLLLLRFSLRLAHASIFTFEEIGSRRFGRFLLRNGRQVIKAFVRGIFPVIGFGIATGIGIGLVAESLGSQIRPIVDAEGLKAILGLVVPLFLSAIIVARQGAAIAAKFASFPITHGAELCPERKCIFDEEELQTHVVPQITATVISAALFYTVFAGLTIGGYMSEGALDIAFRLGLDNVRGFIRLLDLEPTLYSGLAKSAACGFVIAYVSSAFGVQSAERALSHEGTGHDFYYAVWESGVTSLLLCLVLTIFL